jgi:hypothetical protein
MGPYSNSHYARRGYAEPQTLSQQLSGFKSRHKKKVQYLVSLAIGQLILSKRLPVVCNDGTKALKGLPVQTALFVLPDGYALERGPKWTRIKNAKGKTVLRYSTHTPKK